LTLTKNFVNDPDMAAKRAQPTKLELTILKALWDAGPSSVRDVQKILDASQPIGYTTVLKMLQIMMEKGLVDRNETVRPQIYRAKSSQAQTQRQMLKDLIQRAYGGSVKALVMQALGTSKTSPETLEEIEKLLDQAEAPLREGSGGQGGS
jgi:BlaI family transcriptional regulator, penicillinase repressor